MPTRPTPTIRYTPLLSVLAKANGVSEAGATAFENRIKHLKRNGYPTGANLGKTGRYDYSPADVLGIAAALRLIDAYAMPAVAIQLVTSSERALAILMIDRIAELRSDILGEDYLRGHGEKSDGPIDFRKLGPLAGALFPGAALSDLGSRRAGGGRYEAPVNHALLIPADGRPHSGRTASGIILFSKNTFDQLVLELAAIGIRPRDVAVDLLATVSPELAIAADKDASHASAADWEAIWHLSMLLRSLGSYGEAADVAPERLVAYHLSFLIYSRHNSGILSRYLPGMSLTTFDIVIGLLRELDLPIPNLPNAPHIYYHTAWSSLGEDHDNVRNWLIGLLPTFASQSE